MALAGGRVMRFWLGTHRPNWLGQTDVPLFISRRTLAERKTLPLAQGPWALDSGGFSELTMHGEWQTTPAQYVAEVRRFKDEMPGFTWAAIQDWMCEPVIRARTGLTVVEHQARSVASYLTLSDLAPEMQWTPVLQGWAIPDYLHHVEQYARAGVDLTTLPLVGVGSVCRRQGSDEITALVGELAALGLRLHGFGMKQRGLIPCAWQLTSSDSMAWSFRARKHGSPMFSSCQHRNCANCLPWALRWRRDLLTLIEQPRSYQLPMLMGVSA